MAHGEHKTPGGKLMRVDLDVRDGSIVDVVVSGDFFLYPEEALDDLRRSIEGVSSGTSVEALALVITDGLRPGAELIGSSPESLAIAVRRAVAAASEADV